VRVDVNMMFDVHMQRLPEHVEHGVKHADAACDGEKYGVAFNKDALQVRVKRRGGCIPFAKIAGVGEVLPSSHRPLPRAWCPKSREAESCDSRRDKRQDKKRIVRGRGYL
jgi:hypothetical protein